MKFPSLVPAKKPLIGILIKNRMARQLLLQNPPPEFSAFVRANQFVDTALFFFSIPSTDLNNKIIKGIYYHPEKKKWLKKKFTYPDVLYRKCSVVQHYTDFWNSMLLNNVRMINYIHGFNKWDVLRLLNSNARTRAYLPETVSAKSIKDVKKMIKKFPILYLKGHQSSRGKLLLQIVRKKGQQFECRYFDDTPHVEYIQSFPELIRKIAAVFHNRKFIIQKGIDLISYNNRIVDVRAQVQRNGKGNLEVICLAVRVGAAESPIATHGTSYPFEQFLKEKMNMSDQKISQLQQDIHRVISEIYQAIEQKHGRCGEMGLDLGIDKKGQVWFIESNAKPMKVSVYNAYGAKGIERSYTTMLEYAKWLVK